MKQIDYEINKAKDVLSHYLSDDSVQSAFATLEVAIRRAKHICRFYLDEDTYICVDCKKQK